MFIHVCYFQKLILQQQSSFKVFLVQNCQEVDEFSRRLYVELRKFLGLLERRFSQFLRLNLESKQPKKKLLGHQVVFNLAEAFQDKFKIVLFSQSFTNLLVFIEK